MSSSMADSMSGICLYVCLSMSDDKLWRQDILQGVRAISAFKNGSFSYVHLVGEGNMKYIHMVHCRS